MNVYNEAYLAINEADVNSREERWLLTEDDTKKVARWVAQRLQPKADVVRAELLVHQMKDIEARMYDAGADLPVIQAMLGAVSKADLNTRLLVHDGLKAWLDLLDERA